MDLKKISVRKDLERMVINYFLRGEITEDQSARICDFIDNTIGGGYFPQAVKRPGRSIIPFPTTYTGPELAADIKAAETVPCRASVIFAPYGEPMPEGIHDFREILQRDGLALICYEKLISNEGAFFNVLWAQADGGRRHTEWSGAIREEQIPYSMPLDVEYRSYYREKQTLIYTVHVAPENILKGPLAEYDAYIQSLKDAGFKNNFNYRFNFAAEKRNSFLLKNKELINLKLPTRIINALNDREIYTVKGLQKITVQELLKIKNLGAATIKEAVSILKEAGITLQEDKENYV